MKRYQELFRIKYYIGLPKIRGNKCTTYQYDNSSTTEIVQAKLHMYPMILVAETIVSDLFLQMV